MYIFHFMALPSTYVHRQLRIGDPVRSRIHKQLTDRLVVGWVTTSESRLMYVLSYLVHPDIQSIIFYIDPEKQMEVVLCLCHGIVGSFRRAFLCSPMLS